MKIKDICVGVTDGSHNPPRDIEISNYFMLSSKNIFDDEITFENPRYLTQSDFEKENKRTRIKKGDVLHCKEVLLYCIPKKIFAHQDI